MKAGKTLAGRNYGPAYSYPMGIWFTVFFLLPILIIVVYSFLKKGLHGGVEWQFSLDAYVQMFQQSYGAAYLEVGVGTKIELPGLATGR